MTLTARDKIRFLKYHVQKPYVDRKAVKDAMCTIGTVHDFPISRGTDADNSPGIPEQFVRDYIGFFAESHPFVRGNAEKISTYLKEHSETIMGYKEYKTKLEKVDDELKDFIGKSDDSARDFMEINFRKMHEHVFDERITGEKTSRNMIYEYDQRSLAAAFSNLLLTESLPSDAGKLEHILNDITNIAIERGADYVKYLTSISGSLDDFYTLMTQYPTIGDLGPKAKAHSTENIEDTVSRIKSELAKNT